MAAEALIHLRSITKVYRMGEPGATDPIGAAAGPIEVQALRGISLEIREGDFVSVMGSSGSGKSTLMNIVGCLDRPTAGDYHLAGRDVSKLGRNALAEVRNRMLGFVFQSYNLLARTSALENVELPLMYAGVPGPERRRRARAALDRVGLGDRLLHHPKQLSGGQQQRVAIARALVGAPRLILADEPTGNLDSRTSLEVMALLQELSGEGITIVLVTHEADISALTSRVLVLRDGRLVADRSQAPKRADPGALPPPEAPS